MLNMERRQESRFETDQQVQVTLLGDNEVTLKARVVNTSRRGMRLILDRSLPLNAAVRIDGDDSILLGEVCYAGQQGAEYAVGLVLDQVLHELTDLTRLAEAILGETLEPEKEPKPSSNR